VGKGNVRNLSSPKLASEWWPRPATKGLTLSYHGAIIIKEYPSVRSTCADPYPVTLVDLVHPLGEETSDILKEGEIDTPDKKAYSHPGEPVRHIVEAVHLRSWQVLWRCH
jgi:hypothetical protein